MLEALNSLDRRTIGTILWGPIGSGKSYAATLMALLDRLKDYKRRTVFVNNPEILVLEPELFYYELIYAFADDSCPYNLDSSELFNHPVGFIQTSFLKYVKDGTSIIKSLILLLQKLKLYCRANSLEFTLIFDQMKIEHYQSPRREAMRGFLVHRLPSYFHKYIGLVSATNDRVLSKMMRNYPILRLTGMLGRPAIKSYTQLYLNRRIISDHEVELMEMAVGTNLLQLTTLLDCNGGTISEKCDSFTKWASEEINIFYTRHCEWLATYEKSYPAHQHYWDFISYCDTGIPVFVPNIIGDDVYRHIDNRYLIYDKKSQLLRSSSPAAHNAIHWAIAVKKYESNMKLVWLLKEGYILDRHIMGLALKSLVYSVFRRQGEQSSMWTLKLKALPPVYVNHNVSFISLGSLRETLTNVQKDNKPCYYPLLPLVNNLPAADLILFNPILKKFILLQVTANMNHSNSDAQLATKNAPKFVKSLISFLVILCRHNSENS